MGDDELRPDGGYDQAHGGPGDDLFVVYDDDKADLTDSGDGFDTLDDWHDWHDWLRPARHLRRLRDPSLITGSSTDAPPSRSRLYSRNGPAPQRLGHALDHENWMGPIMFLRNITTQRAVTIGGVACAAVLALSAGAASAKTIHGTNNDDTLGGSAQPDVIRGYLGNDNIFAKAGKDRVYGGAGADDVWGNPGADELYGQKGVDHLFGGIGADHLDGGARADVVAGDEGNDEVRGGGGADSVSGGPGDDLLVGGTGGDTIWLPLFSGQDKAYAGAGNDLIKVENDEAPDLINCGDGLDTVDDHGFSDETDTYISCEFVLP